MEEIEDILMEQKPDRRLLPNVPDPELQRTNSDRRGANADDIVDKVKKNIHENHSGVRFLVDYPVDITLDGKKINSPSYVVLKGQEDEIGFYRSSPVAKQIEEYNNNKDNKAN